MIATSGVGGTAGGGVGGQLPETWLDICRELRAQTTGKHGGRETTGEKWRERMSGETWRERMGGKKWWEGISKN
jgi:hypothetical protein